MEERSLTPLIIIAFSHERNETKPPIRNLLKEQMQINSLLSPMVQQNLCETRAMVNVTVERLSELIEREKDRIVGLHYGSDVATLIRVREGKRKSMERALKGKLGRQIGALPRLKWMFLSGDGSQEQAEALMKVGVPLIMRSHNLISDDAAYRLAYFFYQTLGQGLSLGEACEQAIFEVRRDYMNKAKLTYGHELPSGYGSDWPFAYHLNPHLPSAWTWSLFTGSARRDGLPRLDEQPLPDQPYRDLSPITSAEAGLFGGRDELLRELYEQIKAPLRPPVLVIYGPRGSGKTSLFEAGLRPLLSGSFTVTSAPFSPGGLEGLSEALGVDEHAPLLKEWFSREGERERSQLNQQAINDLINEVQALFKSYQRGDTQDFPSFLQTVRALWLKSGGEDDENLLMRLGELFNQQEQASGAEQRGGGLNRQPLLVCLDQVERAFEELDQPTARRQERFWGLVRELCVDPERVIRGALILIVDELAYPALKQTLRGQMIQHAELYVPQPSARELERYLKRFASERSLQERYPLITDEGFARRLSNELERRSELVGARLQALLRLMWRQSDRRPLMWTEEALHRALERLGDLSLRSLLSERVDSFIELMRLQGDEDFNELLALDLLYYLCLSVYQPARFHRWLSEARPSLMGRQSDLSGSQGLVSVEPFLEAYLGWGEQLPERWSARRRALADQTLWALTQAIDLGLLRGQLGAGESLPTGELSLPHALLFEITEERWERLNGGSIRQVQRFMDLLARGEEPSLAESTRSREAFLHTRLPNLREAEALQRGLDHSEELAGRAEAKARRGSLMRWLSFAVVMLVGARCAQVSLHNEELSEAQRQLKDRVLLHVADQMSERGELGRAAALLGEVESAGLNGWSKEALKVLSSPIPSGQVSDQAEWSELSIGARGLMVTTKRGDLKRIALSPSGDVKQPLLIGAPLLSAMSPSGEHWAQLTGDELGLYSGEQQRGRFKLSPAQSSPKQLLVGPEGAALLLDQAGELSSFSPGAQRLIRAPRRLVKLSQSPRGSAVITEDDRGSLRWLDLREQRVGEPIVAPTGARLIRRAWDQSVEALVAIYKVLNSGGGAELIVVALRPEAPAQTLYRGAEDVDFVALMQGGGGVVGLKSAQALIIGLEGSRKSLPLRGRGRGRGAYLSPDGSSLAIQSRDEASVQWIDLLGGRPSRELRAPGPIRGLELSEDGAHLLMMTQQTARVWRMSDSSLLADFEHPRGALLGASLRGGRLYAGLITPEAELRSHLKVWPLKAPSILRRVYWPGDEPSEAHWGGDDALWVGTGQGELYAWGERGASLTLAKAAHEVRVSALSALPSGALISGAEDGTLLSVNPRSGMTRQLIAHKAPVRALKASADGQLIISADDSGLGASWSADGALLTSPWQMHEGAVRSLEISPDRSVALSIAASGEAKLWRMMSSGAPELITAMRRELLTGAFIGSGERLEALTLDRSGALEAWSLVTGEARVILPPSERFELGAMGPRGQVIVRTFKGGEALMYSLDDPRTLRAPRSILSGAGSLSAVEVIDADRVALGGEGGELWLWSRDEGARRLGRHEGSVKRIEASPDGASLLSRSATQAIVWRGPFDHATLAQRLRDDLQLCLSVQERVALLGESSAEAAERQRACVERTQ